ncbi:hypothetical protein Efla_004324 [Eimeria flavescens]
MADLPEGRVSCLDAIHEARTKSTDPPPEQNPTNGTSVLAFGEADDDDCVAAVEYWRSVVSNFDTLPPSHEGKKVLYEGGHEDISLIGHFNTSEKPPEDCAVIACQARSTTKTTIAPSTAPTAASTTASFAASTTAESTTASTTLSDGQHHLERLDRLSRHELAEQRNSEGRKRLTSEKSVSSLLCLFSPRAIQVSWIKPEGRNGLTGRWRGTLAAAFKCHRPSARFDTTVLALCVAKQGARLPKSRWSVLGAPGGVARLSR